MEYGNISKDRKCYVLYYVKIAKQQCVRFYRSENQVYVVKEGGGALKAVKDELIVKQKDVLIVI